MEDELQIEGFNAWVLAATLAVGGTSAAAQTPTPTAASQQQASNVSDAAMEYLRFCKVDIPAGYKIIETDRRFPGTSDITKAFSYRDGGRKEILIAKWSKTYKRIAEGPGSNYKDYREALIMMASEIVHEITHMEDGPTVSDIETETNAYNAQLTALTKMGAQPNTISIVKKSKDYALQHLRHDSTARK